ncbi:MAG TPA: dihydropteroate synthase [Burkholderiales bacterium]|nr:dihydropteroate synthase [Burkholderiales bacterium]
MTGVLRCGHYQLALDRPLVMGIVNVTPDSFFDGGRYADARAAAARARRLVEEGADLVDIGGESSRPGAAPVPADEELTRVLPVLEALGGLGVPVSVDTTKPEVMREALARGATMINDITALAAPGAVDIVARSDAAVCLMHMQGDPQTMQTNPVYRDVVAEVRDFLAARAAACIAGGVGPARIVVDPGFSFGKATEHNLRLLARLDAIAALGYPVLVGLSRKSSLGRITGETPDDRLPASLTGAILAVQRGARIVRVHEVAATRNALAVLAAVERQQ